jgi:Ni/Co efflux regulator RcnB
MKNQWLTCLTAALLLLLASVSAVSAEAGVSVEFSDREISVIRAYYREQAVDDSGKGNGRKGKGKNSLPPGIAKNLQRGKALPPGIAKNHLPGGLVAMLPAPPRGFERLEIDGRVLLVEVATQVIHDVLSDAILR